MQCIWSHAKSHYILNIFVFIYLGEAEGWKYVGYFGWGLGLASTCVGIITSQGGSSSTDLNKLEEEREQARAK